MLEFTVDLHVHTVHGSSDSSLEIAALRQEAARIGLHAVCVSEHERIWSAAELATHNRDGLRILPATEWSTDLGHVLVLGLAHRTGGIHRADELRRHVLDAGGLMIAAHPFRYALQPWHFRLEQLPAARATPTIAEAARLPLLEFVDAVEALNGNCTDEENELALAVAHYRGLPVTAGSDAHGATALGSCVTLFAEPIRTVEALIDALRAGRCRPATGLRRGDLRPVELPART